MNPIFVNFSETDMVRVRNLVSQRMVDLIRRATVVNREMTIAETVGDRPRFVRGDGILAKLIKQMDIAVLESNAPVEFKASYVSEVMDRRPPETRNYESLVK